MMMSAAAMSAKIRAKKKKMMDEDGAMTESGIPEDAQDIAVIKNKEYGELLNDNMPKDRDEEPTAAEEIAEERKAQAHEESAPDPKLGDNGAEEDPVKLKRLARMRAMLKG